MKRALKYPALPLLPLFVAYLAFWYCIRESVARYERRHGIVHEANELCRKCGLWHSMHNRFLGSMQSGCMIFRGRA